MRPLTRIPEKAEMVLFLIQEELKSRKLFDALHQVGLDDCFFQPHLDLLILKSMGLNDGRDETFERYSEILEKRSRKIQADADSISKQAMKVYVELVGVRERLSNK